MLNMNQEMAMQKVQESKVNEIIDLQIDRPKDKKTRKPRQGLFSFGNGQSMSTQLDDTVFVLRQMVRTRKSSATPSRFTKRYITNPIFKNDMFVISFGLPALSATPRVLNAAPSVRSDASNWTYHGEKTAPATKGLLNVASYNYLGFVDLEHHTRQLLEHSVRELPFADDEQNCNHNLEEAMKSELKAFMDMKGCVLTPTGYAINLVAFPAMAASSKTGYTIFLMDSESHSSMFMGAYIACSGGKGKVIKFRHNDVKDLKAKLDQVYEESNYSAINLWVTIEGLYSMDGTVPPLPAIIGLRNEYDFKLYVDEAHSFLAIGRTGRGVVEYFHDLTPDGEDDEGITIQDIDMLGGTISKSMSSVGGFVLSSEPLAEHLEARIAIMRASGGSSIPTLSLIRTLQIIKKPALITQRLAHLRSISAYTIAMLEAKGYSISATEGGPLVAIVVDTIDRVLAFLRAGRQVGLICCGAAYPAAPRGAPRVRLSLTGAHTWANINEILRIIDEISTTIGVKGLNLRQDFSAVKAKFVKGSTESASSDEARSVTFSDAVDASVVELCPPAIISQSPEEKKIRAAGLAALQIYNLGAAGPRWMCGTFSAHMTLEERLNNTLKSVIGSAITLPSTAEPIQTSLVTDTRIGIMSIIANCMEGLAPRRSKKGERHLILLPKAAGAEIREGAAAAQPDRSVATRWYDLGDSDDGLERTLSTEFLNSSKKVHLTIYIDPSLHQSSCSLAQLTTALSSLITKSPLSLTLLINDPSIFTSSFASTHSILLALSPLFSSPSTRFLVFGSFHALSHLPGLQGAFMTGSKHLIEKVQFLGQGIMYTAMMPPVTAALAEESLKVVVKRMRHEDQLGV